MNVSVGLSTPNIGPSAHVKRIMVNECAEAEPHCARPTDSIAVPPDKEMMGLGVYKMDLIVAPQCSLSIPLELASRDV